MAATKAVHECLFCPQTFESAATKDDHVLEHFAQEICSECNQNMILIGGNLYMLHNARTCIKSKNQQVVCERQSLFDDEEDHENISAFSGEDLLESTDAKTEPITSNAQFYDCPDLDNMSEAIEVKIESIEHWEDEHASNNFDESRKYENEDEIGEHLEFNSDSSMDVDAYEGIYSNTQKKYSYIFGDTGSIECPICKKEMSKLEQLRKHMKMKHDPCKKFKCSHCKIVFLAISSLKNHLPQCRRRKKINYGDKIHDDDMIEIHGTMDLEMYNEYWSSLPIDAGIGQFECPICKKIYAKMTYLLRHMKLQHDPRNKNLKCVNCCIVFLKNSSLQKHLLRCKRKKESTKLENQLVENQECEAGSAMNLKKYNEFWSKLPEDKCIGRFKCPICRNVYAKKEYLLQHMKMQHDPSCKKFKCAYCKSKYLSESGLENHIPRCRKRNSDTQTHQLVDNTVNPNYATGIPLDLQTYRDIYSRLVNDNSQIDENEEYECPICKKVVTKLQYLRTHMKMKHDPSFKKFKCIYCSIVYVSESSLEKHLPRCKQRKDVVPKSVNQFECPICQKKLAKKNILRMHIKRQHDPNRKAFKCAQCKLVFSAESSLEDHLPRCKKRKVESEDGHINCKRKVVEIENKDTKTPKELHICYLCVTIFQSGDELTKHKLDCKPNQSKHPFVEKYECYICHINVTTKQALKRHLECMHDPNAKKRVTCQLCEKQFHVNYIRRHHEITHMNFRKYLCTICGQVSATKTLLKTHMWRHTGEKPLECLHDGCNKRFTTSNSRTEHMRTHTGEKPIHCTIDGCNKRFKFRTDFRTHKVKKHNQP